MTDTQKQNQADAQLDELLMKFSNSKASDTKSRMTPADRMKMIEQAFEEILGRKPDTRDLNYYKYSSLSEDEVRKELISGKEHKMLLENGREFKKVKDLLNTKETKIKVLESQISDREENFKELNALLKEKNAHIQELREKLKNPFEQKCCVEKKCSVVEEVEIFEEDLTFSKIWERFLSIFS